METNNKKLIEELEKELLTGDYVYKPKGEEVFRYVTVRVGAIEAAIEKLKQLEQIYQQ